MNRNKKIFLIIVILIGGLLLLKAIFQKNPEEIVNETEDTVEQEDMVAPTPDPNAPVDVAAGTSADTASQSDNENSVDPSLVQAQFMEALKTLGTCLDIKNAIDTEQKEPRLENLVASVRNEIGDPVIRSEDWSNTLVTLPNGEQRRIRIEMEYDADDRIVKRLKYYKAEKDNLIPIPLDNSNSTDPQDSFIASLEGEGKVAIREKGSRMYFQNGEEIVFVEKNDQIADIEMNRNGRTFKCVGLDSGRSTCSCL